MTEDELPGTLITAVPGTPITAVPGMLIDAAPGTVIAAVPGTALLEPPVATLSEEPDVVINEPEPDPAPNLPALLPAAPPKKSQAPEPMPTAVITGNNKPSWIEGERPAASRTAAAMPSELDMTGHKPIALVDEGRTRRNDAVWRGLDSAMPPTTAPTPSSIPVAALPSLAAILSPSLRAYCSWRPTTQEPLESTGILVVEARR